MVVCFVSVNENSTFELQKILCRFDTLRMILLLMRFELLVVLGSHSQGNYFSCPPAMLNNIQSTFTIPEALLELWFSWIFFWSCELTVMVWGTHVGIILYLNWYAWGYPACFQHPWGWADFFFWCWRNCLLVLKVTQWFGWNWSVFSKNICMCNVTFF